MKALKYLAIVLGGFFLFAACRKELSFENGFPVAVATGSLKDTLGNCLPISVNGKYVRNTSLSDSNFVVVQVNFSSPGSYNISTDTSNGFSFQASGITVDSGVQAITLKGVGKPAAAQPTNFAVTFDSSICTFSINVSDSAIVTPTTSNDYFPTTDSSNWTYDVNTGSPTPDDSINTVVTLADEVIAGNTYRKFAVTTNGTTDTNYYRKGNGIYYQYGDLNDLSIFDAVSNNIDYIFLKDNVPVSSTWESPEVNATFGGVSGKVKIKFTIEGKDIQTTIGNTTIDSVIQVQREYMFAPSLTGLYSTIVSGDFYYAKNIGFIKAEASEPEPVSIIVRRWEIYY